MPEEIVNELNAITETHGKPDHPTVPIQGYLNGHEIRLRLLEQRMMFLEMYDPRFNTLNG